MAAPCTEHEFIVAAEDYQFYLQDEQAEPEFPETIQDELAQDLFSVGEHIIAVGTVRPTDVHVIVECSEDEPEEESFEDWDQVIECSMSVPSGIVVVTSNNEPFESAARVTIAPGIYRLRIYFGMLEEVDQEGFEGDDFYKILFWPGKLEEPKVLKKWFPPINFAP